MKDFELQVQKQYRLHMGGHNYRIVTFEKREEDSLTGRTRTFYWVKEVITGTRHRLPSPQRLHHLQSS